ncbi:MAG: glycosyltransferase [Candidatus Saccharibacteria bacterium]|nr:glycosyltransferase [Candidatus Saccharibacteria bacterium]
MTKTTWIDITDMIGWTGQFGGTQRVVYGIANEYVQYANKHKNTSVKFCFFSEKTRKFYETSFDVIKPMNDIDEVSKNDKMSKNIDTKERVKIIIQTYVPNRILSNAYVKRYGKTIGKQVYGIAKKAKNELGPKKITIINEPEAIFEHNDTVLLLGKPWDTPMMMPTLQLLKEQKGFLIETIIYDLVISLQPQLHTPVLFKDYTQYLFYVAQCSDRILPISKSSERDFYEFCDRMRLPKPESKVIRIGDIIHKSKEPTIPRQMDRQKSKQFLLCVGTIEVRKNHALLYYVYKLAHERGINLPQLVIVGRVGWNAKDIYTMYKNDPLIKEQTIILDSVTDPELSWLYENCLFSVYPSMYEGWGLPVAESLQYGKVVVASNSSSIPEIAGELLEYFSPYSVDECLHLILKYLDDERRTALEKKIHSNYSPTNWRHTFMQVNTS